LTKEKRYFGEIEPQNGEVCSEEGCGRPAVTGHTFRGEPVYDCAEHWEIKLLGGQVDWLDGERHNVEDMLKQARAWAEKVWVYRMDTKLRDGKGSYLLLVDESEHATRNPDEWPDLDPWVTQFMSLLSAVEVAEKLTEEKIEALKRELAK
jgi:hypothetical protein